MFSNNEWDDVPDDPDPHENLDYEMEELTVIQSETDEKYVFLPAEESHLLEDAFIVASADALVELRE
ncbi:MULTISPECIES: hypothetical protein [Haloarcula]|uniref:Uncharacterized protein n=1 Tax=Haloarcula pellucida TaxID=1427151 RepID=A0A830GHX8_9EURY|nr:MULTISPECIES: hypothetical protein [Halomicroarcula]MBX0347348.1 hypothetical protein [Halomicroarcula pellucida]MDS0276778.1 hypothetical protein [Halomicroarcula sp. S1AR25-4]GGN88212.1 hypothetical protein GCM10009030_07710 [Halomicroarcula pellucida]